MWDSISTTSKYLRETLELEQEIKSIAKNLVEEGVERILFTACGTSNHLGLAGEYFFQEFAKIEAKSVHAFELSNYYPLKFDKKIAVVAISHSGGSKATIDAVRYVMKKGAKSVAITHIPNSPLAEIADRTLILPGSESQAGPKTRSYTCGLLALSLLSISLGELHGTKGVLEYNELRKELNDIPRMVESILINCKTITEELSVKYKDMKDVYIVGGGLNYVTTLEAAMKMKETMYIHAEGQEIEETAHLFFIGYNKGTVTFVIAPKGRSCQRALDIVNAANVIGFTTISIVEEDDSEISKISTETIKIPYNIRETFTPMLYIIPLQMLTYQIAVNNGYLPDTLKREDPNYLKAHQIFQAHI